VQYLGGMYVHDVDMPPASHEYYNCECVPYDMYVEIEVSSIVYI
jgi:hypothetical protein